MDKSLGTNLHFCSFWEHVRRDCNFTCLTSGLLGVNVNFRGVNINFRAFEKSIWVLEKSLKFVSKKGYEPCLRPPCLCSSEGHKHGVSIQSSTNLGDTLLQITREWKTAESLTWFLARLFLYQSSIVSQILNFIHWMVTIFSFDHMTGENRELGGKRLVSEGLFFAIAVWDMSSTEIP